MEKPLRDYLFYRVAVAAPELRVGDVPFNLQAIEEACRKADAEGADLIAFPELCITGYTCADLFFQRKLLQASCKALADLVDLSRELRCAIVVGMPWEAEGRMFNCGVVVASGRVLGIVPKLYMPNYNEFYEDRWFSSGQLATVDTVTFQGEEVPFGTGLLFRDVDFPDATFGLEICEDLWAPAPPSAGLALAGATVLVNPSASPEILGKAGYRRDLVSQQSARCLAGYLYAGSGPGESTTDLVFSGACLVGENGQILVESRRFSFDTTVEITDIDIGKLLGERLKNTSFATQPPPHDFRLVEYETRQKVPAIPPADLKRYLPKRPFVPGDQSRRAEHCGEIFAIQASGLAKRLRHIGGAKAVIGLSGGLDSTLALLVCIKALDMLERPHADIVGITMPGFGTTERTKGNATELAELLGVTLRTIPIHDAVEQHFKDIGHDPNQHDVTYENSQARERTQILMDVSNQVGGIVIGTGDLSELALGWCTYNGDHMSMYAVNTSVPKTLVRYLVEWVADHEFEGRVREILRDISATPITPELLPLDNQKQLLQETEKSIGPYVLHDFFLFHSVRQTHSPRKILFLAEKAFGSDYSRAELLKWLQEFYRRFFNNQFKRSAIPDGPKVGTVALSPRGDWRMPSDASAAVWLDELAEIEKEMESG